MKCHLLIFSLLSICCALFSADKIVIKPEFLQAPKFADCEFAKSDGMRSILFDGPQWNGKATKVFAYLGLPKIEAGQKVPGIVLVHGGGGTAFDTWVKMWTERGYAAIALDTCGCYPLGTDPKGGKYSNKWTRLEDGGPPGFGGFDQLGGAIEDHWMYHAVCNTVIANSLLCSLPEVDASKIGLTGVSWGGIICCSVAGLDERFAFSVPVYGAGYLDESAGLRERLSKMGEAGARWYTWFDPKHYLPNAKAPILFMNGTNDMAFSPEIVQKSAKTVKGPVTLAIPLGMKHGHGGASEKPEEIHIFANSIVKGGDPAPKILSAEAKDGVARVTFSAKKPVNKVELLYTADRESWNEWRKKKWEALPAAIKDGSAELKIPDGTTVWYFNVYDERGVLTSSEYVETKN